MDTYEVFFRTVRLLIWIVRTETSHRPDTFFAVAFQQMVMRQKFRQNHPADSLPPRKASPSECFGGCFSRRTLPRGHGLEKFNNQPDIFSGWLCISMYASCNNVILSRLPIINTYLNNSTMQDRNQRHGLCNPR